MSSNKRRKIDIGQGTQMLSAAALRRRLLVKQASATTAEVSEDSGTSSADNVKDDSSDVAPSGGNSKREAVARTAVAKETSRTPEQVLLGTFGTIAEDEYETTDPVDEPPKRKAVQFSSINPNKSNLQTKADGTVVLRFPDSSERLVILGSYGIKVKSGEASIYGATLFPSDTIHWAHAPHCHALPVLRCSEKSIIELHPHPGATALRNLERLSPLFGNLWNDSGQGRGAEREKTWQILPSSADGPKKAMLQDLKSPATWNRKIADLVKTRRESAAVLLVCGPKSSGKSTFTRIVANRLVTEQGGTKKRTWPGVAVLDIDPGQPEFSPPGTISLVTLDQPNLSPPFCHPMLGGTRVVRSHAVASITPASDVEHYKSCVLDLFSRHRASSVKSPLIINTPGWVQGSGLVLLQDLISAICPTEVLYMSEDGPEDTVEGLRSACRGAALTTLPSQSSEYTSRTALHLRHMQAMSYFHADAATAAGAGARWDPAPLASVPPWLVRYGGADGGILGLVCYGYQPEPELLAEAIDGTVLAVVEVEHPRAFGAGGAPSPSPPPPQDLAARTPRQIPYLRGAAPLDPAHSRCLGLALVRGVDAARGLLALSTPLPADAFATGGARAIVLVAGKFDPPTWAYTEDHYSRAYGRGGGEDEEDNAPGDIPWAEKLHGGQRRAVGSRVWRVRRDLGRSNAAGGD